MFVYKSSPYVEFDYTCYTKTCLLQINACAHIIYFMRFQFRIYNKHVYDNFLVFVFTFNIRFSFVSKVGFVNDLKWIFLYQQSLQKSIQMNTINDISMRHNLL